MRTLPSRRDAPLLLAVLDLLAVLVLVRAAWVLSKPELAERAADLFAQDRPGRLVLVTCFDHDGSQYLANAVVSAMPLSRSEPL